MNKSNNLTKKDKKQLKLKVNEIVKNINDAQEKSKEGRENKRKLGKRQYRNEEQSKTSDKEEIKNKEKSNKAASENKNEEKFIFMEKYYDETLANKPLIRDEEKLKTR